MAHFVQYLHRRVLLPTQSSMASQRHAARQPDTPPFDFPQRHVLPDQPIIHSIVEGDTIWMISQLSLTRAGATSWLPVALDARIRVGASPRQKRDSWVVEAIGRSRWFPLADATSVLNALRSVSQNGATPSLRIDERVAVGQHFQSMRRLDDADPLQRWALRLALAPVEFVSYRQIDGTSEAFDFASERLRAGAVLFWDKWSLPRRLSERREHVADGPLDVSLLRAIDEASRVWGLQTPCYGEAGRYAAKEADRARARGVFTAVHVPAVGPPGVVVTFPGDALDNGASSLERPDAAKNATAAPTSTDCPEAEH